VSLALSDSPSHVGENSPKWYSDSRKLAWQKFLETPWPSRKDEDWRFANLKKLSYENVCDSEQIDNFDYNQYVSNSVSLKGDNESMIFNNDRLQYQSNLDDELLDKGLIFKPLSLALVENADLLKSYFMKEGPKLGSEKLLNLHKARQRNGYFIYVPEGLSLKHPLEIFHWLSGENNVIFPYSLIVTGAGSSVKVAEYTASSDDEFGLACGVSDLIAEEGSELTYVRTQNLSEKAHSVHISNVSAHANSTIKNFSLNLGCEWLRQESVCRLLGDEAHSEMISVNVPENNQEFDMRTMQLHEHSNTSSDLLYKNALYDKSKTTFAGMIKVEDGAHFTDAYQTCRNLLMSDECEANSMPGLEIKADQVKCSHGSTSNPVAEEELFYLMSRGIEEPISRQLVTFGFVKDAVDRLNHPQLEEVVLGKLERRFKKIGVR
tara:strand:+ start:1475 stop:2776 length:1302 start_codon:yes stop_codon:yes gene_type:complete